MNGGWWRVRRIALPAKNQLRVHFSFKWDFVRGDEVFPFENPHCLGVANARLRNFEAARVSKRKNATCPNKISTETGSVVEVGFSQTGQFFVCIWTARINLFHPPEQNPIRNFECSGSLDVFQKKTWKDFFSEKSLKSSNIFELDKIYLLNIWSSWCVPCRQEHTFLMNLNSGNKLNIIGMNYKDNPRNAEKFLKELGNPYKEIFIDLDGTIAIEWAAYGVPESFLIYNNKIIKKYIGPLNQKSIDEINLLIK